ncbi:TPA: hypothetical protein ACQZEI_004968 [Escherichia coli]
MSARARKAGKRNQSERRQDLIEKLWEDDEIDTWHRLENDGYSTVPRYLPLIGDLMDGLSKGSPLSTTYLALWFRVSDEGLIEIRDKAALAFESGFIDRNLNPQKTKKAPQNGCFFNTPCAPYERKRLLNRMTLIDTGYEWRFFAPFPVKWTQLPLCGSQPHTCCRASRSCIRTSSASR